MSRFKFRTWDKRAKVMEQYYGLQLAPSGQLYSGGLNVTCHYEIMQCTGLKDKNGKEIYEGDIVENGGYPELCVVEFYEGQYIGRYAQNSYIGLSFYVIERNSITVVGNIHENPELLEG